LRGKKRGEKGVKVGKYKELAQIWSWFSREKKWQKWLTGSAKYVK